MLWLALHLPLLSLEAFCASVTDAKAKAVALMAEHRLTAVNAAAAAAGVRAGMKRATALALVPELLLGEADAARDAAALTAVAHVALAFTPAVALQDGEATVLLEVRASLRLFGGLPALHGRLGAALAPLAHRVQIAAAPTALGAALLARWGEPPGAPFHPVLGPHATQRRELVRLLDAAPVWLLGPGREHWEAIQGMGLHTLGDLRALPRAGLARRFGEGLLEDLDKALGVAPDPRRWLELPARFESRLELHHRADTTEQVLAAAAVLLARLVAWAEARHGLIAAFTLVMKHEPRHQRGVAPATELRIELAEPALDAAHLQLLLRERLAKLRLAAPTLELQLRCREVVAGAPPNGELFPTHSSQALGLARLLERLRARLGDAQVQRLEPVADHRPERASRRVPALGPALSPTLGQRASASGWAERTDRAGSRSGRAGEGKGQGGGRSESGGGSESANARAEGVRSAVRSAAPSVPPNLGEHHPLPLHRPLHRPVWLLPEPLPLAERHALPMLDGQPLQLVSGPERIEAGWWDGEPAARDYFIALAADGSLVWVWRRRLPASASAGAAEVQWMLQGRFA